MNTEIQFQVKALARGEVVPSSKGLESALQELGLEFRRDEHRIALVTPLELLDAQKIGDGLSECARQQLSQLDIFWQIDSTNTWLLNRSALPEFHGSVCLAEQQLAGKGRRGRHWVSPFGKNIYCSLGWMMSTRDVGVSGLSLVVGMQVAGVLREMGLVDVGLKWPNDVLLSGGKLAGILVEMAASPRGEARLVIGMGINLRLDAADAGLIDQKFSTISDQVDLSRNLLAAKLIDRLVPELVNFADTGFAPYAAQWDDFNLYAGKSVRVNLMDKVVSGIDRGVDASGNLQLETDHGMQSFNAGEVSLRPVI